MSGRWGGRAADAKPTKELSRADLQREIEKASAAGSKVNQELIDAGHGYTKPTELMKMPGPLMDRYRQTTTRERELIDEKEARMRYQGTMHPIKPSKWG